MDNPNEHLNDLLQSGEAEVRPSRGEAQEIQQAPSPITRIVQDMDLCQWQVSPNGVFRPAAKTIATLEPGAYCTDHDDLGPFLKVQPLLSDEIVELPDSANTSVLGGIQKFWTAKDRYAGHGLVFKRGVLLWGHPGSGKTVTIHLLARDLIRNGGIVLFCGSPKLMLALMTAVRRIEPVRPLIVVLEDIDEIIGQHGEHEVLSMLDGENQTANVVYVATTNYPERLGARIVNRPSRFDERVYVGMPSLSVRRAYLQKAGSNGSLIDAGTVAQWASETDGLSIAHLRELVAAVLCLEQPFGEVLQRLRSMNERPKDVDGFGKRKLGFDSGALQGSLAGNNSNPRVRS